MTPRLLIIAGSDSGGGAGVQADLKTAGAHGVYAATAITAVTVQDTRAVHAVHPVPPDVIADQVRVVLDDIGADAVKIGMLGGAEAGEAVLDALSGFDGPLVLDPVLVATSGDALGDEGVARLIAERFVPRASVVTPNLEELARLTGQGGEAPGDVETAARALLARGAGAVLAKGGHAREATVTDLLVTEHAAARIEHPRQDTRHTHGTGCTLASALAAGLACGAGLERAAREAAGYVAAAIRHAPGLGQGHGPLQHALTRGEGGWAPVPAPLSQP